MYTAHLFVALFRRKSGIPSLVIIKKKKARKKKELELWGFFGEKAIANFCILICILLIKTDHYKQKRTIDILNWKRIYLTVIIDACAVNLCM